MAVNAHTHLYSGLCAFGMPRPSPPPRSFPDILREIWWRLDRALDLAALRAAARWYAAQALLSGTTTLVDHHESPRCVEGSLDVLADACAELGIRAVLCYGATERNGGVEEARRGLRECRRFLEANRRPLVRGAVGLHASFTLGDAALREAGALCRELGAIAHVHVAEDAIDVEDARARGHAGPLERLLALGALPEGSILAHGVHLGPAQVRLAAGRGLWLAQCPRSNRQNGVGYPAALRESDRVALGTDGLASEMAEEAAALRAIAAEAGDDPAAADRRLAAGEALAAELFGEDAARDTVVLAAGEQGPRVQSVVIAGEEVVSGGRLTRADLGTIRAEAEEAAARLWQRMQAL
jgi:cytosine/adenosine deaminase-related metal-dependent hydrolase